ncbi:MAG: nucleotidyltransferase domain-containing protein [Bacteroidota bacterium]
METKISAVIETWKNTAHVKGILLAGSFATQLHNKSSDVDLRIIVEGTSLKKEKRIDIIDGIEYSLILGTIDAFAKQIEQQYYQNSKFEARVFSSGKILYDTKNELQDLKEDCKQIVSASFQKNTLKVDTFNKYKLHKELHNLKAIDSQHFLYNLYYQHFLKAALDCYATYLQFDVLVHVKLHKVLFDETYMQAYRFEQFPDPVFLQLWKKAVSETNRELFHFHAEKIYQYLTEKWGEFSVDKLALSF